MLAKVNSVHFSGLQAYMLDVEVDITAGLPTFNVVGLPDVAVKEAKERVRSAIQNCEYDFPMQKITVNLAPAHFKKEGPSFDLPIAIAILKATQQIKNPLDDFCFVGELSLTGKVGRIAGSLLLAERVKKAEKRYFFVPSENAKEASLITGQYIVPIRRLDEAVDYLNNKQSIKPYQRPKIDLSLNNYEIDYSEVKGQSLAKRALEIAAAGGHNLLMVGSPGAGKSMLANRLPTIMPPISKQEAIDITKIYSVIGLTGNGSSVISKRPFRAPHHTVSSAGLIGGGSKAKPGEISLSHLGVLFLDELTEFNRDVLEALRQPLEQGSVSITRVRRQHTYPANFCLIAAMNPCRCGYYGDKAKRCICTPNEIRRYKQKLSGPLLERIDLHVPIERLNKEELVNYNSGESSEHIRERVMKAVNTQTNRLKGCSVKNNSQLQSRQLKEFCKLDETGISFLNTAVDKLGLSGRSYDKILRISRTIADLGQTENIKTEHIAEAIQFRQYDRQTVY